MILVSSCLVGVNCTYSGKNNLGPELEMLFKKGMLLPFCPEVMGGLDTPRDPCEIKNVEGQIKVLSNKGDDCTKEFKDGAARTLAVCKCCGINNAILKFRSPSCGFGKIYDGTFTHTLKEGNGLTADLLAQNGIRIFNENNYQELIDHKTNF